MMNLPKLNSAVKYADDLLNISSQVTDLNGSAKLYYRLNDDYLYDANNKIISNSISKSQNVTVSNSTKGLSNGKYTLETILVYDGINITQKNYFTVNKNSITLNVSDITGYINQTRTLDVELIDNKNKTKKISEGIITVSYANKTVIASAKVSNNHAKISLTNTKAGKIYTKIL